ncbi:MAG TPA: hypothetical protein VHG92_02825 [Afifellaceae bacterium]|nr:hypothetical protein [Afifellaceae bacterium]
MSLFYGDDFTYRVELHDRVEVRLDGRTYDGVVTALHRNEVTVRYEDDLDCRRDGEPKRRTRRFPLPAVDLIARDG